MSTWDPRGQAPLNGLDGYSKLSFNPPASLEATAAVTVRRVFLVGALATCSCRSYCLPLHAFVFIVILGGSFVVFIVFQLTFVIHFGSHRHHKLPREHLIPFSYLKKGIGRHKSWVLTQSIYNKTAVGHCRPASTHKFKMFVRPQLIHGSPVAGGLG